MSTAFHNRRKSAPPIGPASLEAMALRYVGRYATTREKLTRYLHRKIAERGWDGDGPPPVEALVERLGTLGYVNDRLFAESRTRSLSRRGYGGRRIDQSLAADGIAPPLRAEAAEGLDPLQAALTLARRKRIGPFGSESSTPETRRRAFAILMRAGHAPDIARRVAAATDPDQFDEEL